MQIMARIAKLPRVNLGCFPTPLVEAKHLSTVLGGPRILIKREDLTGLALGGNKCRRFEFLLGYAIQKGFDSFLTSDVSNTSVQLVAAARKLGVTVRLVVLRDVTTPEERQGNYLLLKTLGSDIRVRETVSSVKTLDDIIAESNSALEREAINMRNEGHNPFVLPSFGSSAVERVGWVNAVEEIWQQLKLKGIEAQYILTVNTAGSTQSGLAVGIKYLKPPFQVIGISNRFRRNKAIGEVVRMSNETIEFLGLETPISPSEITVYDEYVGEGYGKLTKECIDAIKLVAQTEGIFLDPIYTGKAMAGLIDLIHNGRFTAKDTLVFIHTGGIPALFDYDQQLTS